MKSQIVGVSGPQGYGKSSALEEMRKLEWAVDSFKVSRAVQKRLGWESLERVMDSKATMKQFQATVASEKVRRDKQIASAYCAPLVLTERSFADIYAYTKLWFNRFESLGEPSTDVDKEWLSKFEEDCVRLQVQTYSAVIYIPMSEHVVFQADPHRADQESAAFVSVAIRVFLDMVKEDFGIPFYTVATTSIEDRALEIGSWLNGNL